MEKERKLGQVTLPEQGNAGNERRLRPHSSMVQGETLSWPYVLIFIVEFCLAFFATGYTAAKWTYVAHEYWVNGVQAEANIFLLFYVLPFGIPIWLAGVACLFFLVKKMSPRLAFSTVIRKILAVLFTLCGIINLWNLIVLAYILIRTS